MRAWERNTALLIASLMLILAPGRSFAQSDEAQASEAQADEARGSEARASEALASEAQAIEAQAREALASEAQAREALASEAQTDEAQTDEAQASEAQASEAEVDAGKSEGTIAAIAHEPKYDIALIERQRAMRRKSEHGQVRSRVSRYLAAAMERFEENEPEEGEELLNRLTPGRLSAMERAMVYRLQAYLAFGAGKFDETIGYFRKVIGEEIMKVDEDIKIRFNIAQLYASLYRWQEMIDAINDWREWVAEPDPLSYYLLGIANYQLGNMEAAIVETEIAVDLSDEPKEGWLQLLAALYTQKEDYANAAPVFEELVMRFPKKAYWVQLSLIYGARENYTGSLAVQQVAYLQGFLRKDKELRRLARSYLYQDLPFDAAKVLEKGIEGGMIEADVAAYEMLANSWIAAREYENSLPPLRKAAALAEDGNLYVRLGQVYLQREDWARAVERLEDAVAKGDLDQPGNVQLLLGIAYYNENRSQAAKRSFARAKRHKKTRKQAERWISHIEREQETEEQEAS
jgi:hypothetical protein